MEVTRSCTYVTPWDGTEQYFDFEHLLSGIMLFG